MDQLILLLIYIILFAVAAYSLRWICTNFQLPPPVLWLAGGILLIIVLLFISRSIPSIHLR